jgi:tryptophanyl-tRNA synthetase
MESNGRILSGIQPTGHLHLGNYLGAIQNWVKLQNDYECLFCIVDLHAITVPQDPAALRQSIRQTAAAYIASGIDPKKSIIFQQSAVSGHSELGWLLMCLTPLGWLNRMTQFKEKSRQSNFSTEDLIKEAKGVIKQVKKASEDQGVRIETSKLGLVIAEIEDNHRNTSGAHLGLYAYPVLMAADILLYHASHVPVGEDQKQHLELCRDIAGAFNRQFNTEYFKLPEPMILGEATRVMSLRDGTKKMSKSDPSDYSRIHLSDSDDIIRAKIQKAKSDMEAGITYDTEKRPEASNLLTIMAAIQGKSRKDIENQYVNSNFSSFKKDIADALIAHIAPIRNEMEKLLKDTAYLDKLLAENAEKANVIAKKNLKQIQSLIGCS